jgi:hypothetical protein
MSRQLVRARFRPEDIRAGNNIEPIVTPTGSAHEYRLTIGSKRKAKIVAPSKTEDAIHRVHGRVSANQVTRQAAGKKEVHACLRDLARNDVEVAVLS